MKVLLINKFLYPKGGDAISTLATGKLLSSKGHEVIFWGMEHPLNPKYSYSDLFVSNVDYTATRGPFVQLKYALNILYSQEAKRKVQKLILKEKPDIVHLNNFAHQISPSILDVFKKFGIPSIMTLRDYKLVCPAYTMRSQGKVCDSCKNGHFYWCLLKKCIKNSYFKSTLNTAEMYLHHKILHIYDTIDIFVATSKFLKKKILEMGLRKKVAYLPNFLDVNAFQPSFEWKEKSLVYFGRLSSEKGLFTLLNAVKGLDIKIIIIGDGPIKADLEEKALKEGIQNILFLGHKSYDELKDLVQNSMAVVLPSEWYETFGRTIIEAYALGKPVIASKIGGMPEIVLEEKTGLTFEAGNADDLRKKIMYLVENPDKIIEMGIEARKFAEENFNPEKHYKGLLEIYYQGLKRVRK